jgi:hypothetical protein
VKDESKLDERIRGYDWENAFQCCGAGEEDASVYNSPSVSRALGDEAAAVDPFQRTDVRMVIATSDGENDGPAWLGLFKLKDGRYAFLSAGCDYTGWDCQSGGSALVSVNLALLARNISPEERARLCVDDRGKPVSP